MHKPSALLQTMIDAARAAGEGLREDFANLKRLEIKTKAGFGDPVSIADLRAEETIKSALRARYPEYGFLGEEGGMQKGEDADYLWLCDPLDGTMNFVCNIPLFAVNIALALKGQVIAGVTYAVMDDEMFSAEEGAGAWLNGERMQVSPRKTLEEAIIAVGIPFAGKPRQEQFLLEMSRLTPRVAAVRRLGAGALDTAYVACGRFDAYWEQSVSAWDMAAGVILVREAGGMVTDTRGGALDLMGGNVLNSNAHIHAALLDALKPEAVEKAAARG